MNIIETTIEGLKIINPKEFEDDRGEMTELVITEDIGFKMEAISLRKNQPNVVKGMHTKEWNKIISHISGDLFLAFIDLREDSPTYEKVFAIDFAKHPKHSIFVPSNVAIGSCNYGKSPSLNLLLEEKVFDPTMQEKMIRWNDPKYNISWPVEEPILSRRDEHIPLVESGDNY